MFEFNVNDNVYVKLTERGRKHHKKIHDELIKTFPQVYVSLGKYNPPEEDKDGWSRWQLWVLMETFGEIMHIGFDPPFETTIRIGNP